VIVEAVIDLKSIVASAQRGKNFRRWLLNAPRSSSSGGGTNVPTAFYCAHVALP